MALDAGQGMAQGGAGVDGAFLGAGFGLASAFGAQQAEAKQAQQAQAAQQAAAQHGVPCQTDQARPSSTASPAHLRRTGAVCASCQAPNPAGREVLHGLRPAVAPAVQHCTECGNEIPAGARFCSGCGTSVGG